MSTLSPTELTKVRDAPARAAPRLPADLGSVSAAVPHGGGVPGVLGGVAVARRLPVSPVRPWPDQGAPAAASVALSGLRLRHVGHGAGTVLHRTRTSLTQWFAAACLVTTQTPGLFALQLQRQLGLARYETAWVLLHKLRCAMVQPHRELLHGDVEADEASVGGPGVGLRGGRVLADKALIVAAVEVRGRGSGRVRLQVVPDASGRSLTGCVQDNVARGTAVRTDGWQGYAPLANLGYRHRPQTRGDDPRRAAKLLPRVHRVFGNLQTWLRGTHHGVGQRHLQVSLDEFTFRFNRRRMPQAAFQTLLGLGAQHAPATYKQLYARESTG